MPWSVDLYRGAETETVALGKALAQDNGLRLGQDGKGVLLVPLGPMEGVVAHCTVGDDINASHQQYRPTGLWHDHISQHQGATAATPGTAWPAATPFRPAVLHAR